MFFHLHLRPICSHNSTFESPERGSFFMNEQYKLADLFLKIPNVIAISTIYIYNYIIYIAVYIYI